MNDGSHFNCHLVMNDDSHPNCRFVVNDDSHRNCCLVMNDDSHPNCRFVVNDDSHPNCRLVMNDDSHPLTMSERASLPGSGQQQTQGGGGRGEGGGHQEYDKLQAPGGRGVQQQQQQQQQRRPNVVNVMVSVPASTAPPKRVHYKIAVQSITQFAQLPLLSGEADQQLQQHIQYSGQSSNSRRGRMSTAGSGSREQQQANTTRTTSAAAVGSGSKDAAPAVQHLVKVAASSERAVQYGVPVPVDPPDRVRWPTSSASTELGHHNHHNFKDHLAYLR
jgi:hypothetical protein